MKRKRSFKKMLNSRGPNIEPCSTPVVILSHSLKVLLLFAFYLLNSFSCISERPFQTHLLLTWQSINYGLMCQRPLKGP